MLTAKSLKTTIVLDSAEVLKLNVPETGKAFETVVRVAGSTVRVPLNAKGVRKVVAAIKANGVDSGVVIITGRLQLAPSFVLMDAGILMQVKAVKPTSQDADSEHVEPLAAQPC